MAALADRLSAIAEFLVHYTNSSGVGVESVQCVWLNDNISVSLTELMKKTFC